MKCIKKENEVKRVKDETAFRMVKEGWSFCKKSEWKTGGRVATKAEVVEEIEVEEKSKKSKKVDKRNKKAMKSAAKKEKEKVEQAAMEVMAKSTE